MACPEEKKMLQMLLFQFEICTGVIRALFESNIFQTYPGQNFEGFLNDPNIKHAMFHFFHDKTRCCKCKTLLGYYPHFLTEAQFKDSFDLGTSLHIKTGSTGRIIQNCLCNVTAKSGANIDKFDTTLMIGMFQQFFEAKHPSIFKKLKEIRDIRNRISHASSLREYSEDVLDQMFVDAENAVLEIARMIPFPSYEKSVKTQIDLLRLSAINQDDVRQMLAEKKFIIKDDKKAIVQLLSKKTARLDKHVKQIGTRLDNMQRNLAKDLKTNKEVAKNQDEMMKTQDQHTVQLDTIQGISEDVYTTTIETKMEQSQQSIAIDVIQNSVEKLENMALDEEEKDSLRKLKTKLNNIPCLAEVLQGVDVGCQTDVESMQFELGERSKTALEWIRAGTDNIQTQNDDVKTTLKLLVDGMNILHGFYSAERLTKTCITQNEPRHQIKTSSSDCLETLSAPYDPSVISSTANIINLAWNPPKHGMTSVVFYEIKYKDCNGKNARWITVATETDKCSTSITDLQTSTDYEFKVRAIDLEGEEGPFSATIKTSTRNSLAKIVQMEAKQMSSGHPAIFKLPLVQPKASTNLKSKTRKFIFGKKNPGNKEKTIMLVGATGTGKSTLIDAMINYIIDVSWDDDFRFSLVDPTDDETNRQSDSELTQTEWMTCYNVCKMDGSKIDYDLNIIDTPGFGDPGEIFRDTAIVDQCCEFLTTLGDQGITCLDAICFVTHAHIEKFTTQQKYMFDTILSIFGQDLESNIFVLMTFSDGNVPPVVNALNAAKVPFKKSFKFNNSALVATSANTEKETFGSLFWKMGQESFRIFFDELQLVDSKSLQLTKEVFLLRKILKDSIQKLPVQIEEYMNQLNVVRQERQILERHQSNIVANRNFEYEVDEIRRRKIDLQPGQYATNCPTCNMTCHFPCQSARNENIRTCYAMATSGNCKFCPSKCHWTIHQRAAFHLKTDKVKVKKIHQELKQKYEIAQEEEKKQRYVLEKNRDSFLTKDKNVMKIIHDVRGYINKLNEIALRPTPHSDLDYIDLQIDVQKREKGYGWEQRIDLYYNMRKEAQLVANITNFKPLVEDAEDIVNYEY